MKPIIEIKTLSKKYKIGMRQPYYSLRDSFVGALQNPLLRFKKKRLKSDGLFSDEFWALKDITFSVQQGEVIGIIGRNGAGKTTLLKILSQITPPTRGEVILRGRIASLLEVGTGFHPELTGRENIYLNGAILGMKRREINRKFDEIVDFAEVEKFLDTPVKHFSTGMYMRLAFAVAAHLEPEILIVDEVLAVGDAAFQKKCLGKMENVAKQGRTVIFISHSMVSIRQLCSRCLLLDKGKAVIEGSTPLVVEKYLNTFLSQNKNLPQKLFKEDKKKEFQLLSVRILDLQGKLTNVFECNESVFIELTCVCRKSIPGLYGYMSLVNKEGIMVLVSDTLDFPPNSLDNLKPDKYKIRVAIPPRTLGHGTYTAYFNFTSVQGTKGFHIDSPQYTCSFQLNDYSTDRGNNRDGYLSTILRWNITEL